MSPSDAVQGTEFLKISLSNDLREIAVAADKIDDFCAERGVPPATVYAVNLSVDELLTNTISYGYDGSDEHRIDLTVHLDGDVVAIEISDDGAPFEPTSAKDPDTDVAIEDRPIGGLGIFLTRQMMDSFEYRRHEGKNVVTLTKNTGATNKE